MYDAILILGGGLKEDGSPATWVRARLDKALELKDETEYFMTLSAWTLHKETKMKDGFPLTEAESMGEYLLSKGVDNSRLLQEFASRDTIGNAYFSRLLHTDPGNLKKLLIVTSEFHMPRSKEIFEWIFNLEPLDFEYELDFLETENIGLDEKALVARVEKEQKSLKLVRENRKNITSLKQLHKWLFSVHNAYTIGKSPRRESGKILDSY